MLIGYARVSTYEQNHRMQIDALKAAGCERIFEDTLSGGAVVKPGLADANAFARPGDSIVTWRLDRLSRSLRDLIDLVGDLEELGLHFQSLTEQIDTSSPMGRMVFHVVGAFAQFERDVIRDRTKAGMAAAKRAGSAAGRPSSTSETQWRHIKGLIDQGGASITSIAKAAGVSKQAVFRRLKAEVG